ncbi:hypothetical protein BO94DRAFT_624482 [Aspergillus sclerotioniger CBS 115572]|uniref:Uncharacterized protein n=1 Tax=Aspergillus sclerotioniger CBS 115572 TaxID=1450535 RepID=A0A317WLG2_9EURO|nr:hypothetical protein BO94DRAFT_624482 [Aspergillus sclerotioniger CBS 115572]PWY87314.1 hypothetical protein BO94DRAFT_624482 [Aspergillus sclerotioniger CBS 115572]
MPYPYNRYLSVSVSTSGIRNRASLVSPRAEFHPNPPLTTTPPLHSSPFRLTSTPSDPSPNETEYTNPNEYYSPYKPKRQWPPDMSKLSPKHQFRLERKYRRRAALKYARPKWTKATKLVQWGCIGFVLVYAMLFMEWDERGSPFDEIRRTFFAGVKGAFSTPPPPGPVRRVAEESTRE